MLPIMSFDDLLRATASLIDIQRHRRTIAADCLNAFKARLLAESGYDKESVFFLSMEEKEPKKLQELKLNDLKQEGPQEWSAIIRCDITLSGNRGGMGIADRLFVKVAETQGQTAQLYVEGGSPPDLGIITYEGKNREQELNNAFRNYISYRGLNSNKGTKCEIGI
jgi:hypothetical protein